MCIQGVDKLSWVAKLKNFNERASSFLLAFRLAPIDAIVQTCLKRDARQEGQGTSTEVARAIKNAVLNLRERRDER